MQNDWRFRDRLLAVNESTLDLILNHLAVEHKLPMADADKYSRSVESAGNTFFTFLNEFDLVAMPVDSPLALIDDGTADESDIAITMASLKLVDVGPATWEHVLEFRRDSDARDKLRRLRLFACENYSGKSKDFI